MSRVDSWRRDLRPALLVQPPLFVIGGALAAAQEAWGVAGRFWPTLGLVLLQVSLLGVLYLLLLMPLRCSSWWQAPRLPWQAGLTLALLGMAVPFVALATMGALGVWRSIPISQWLLALITGGLPLALLFPGALVVGIGLLEYSVAAEARARRQSLQALQSLARHREARLRQLRLQLHPHFLFNALNSVAALLVLDRPSAVAMLARLQSLYGRSLRSLERPLVPIGEELDWCREYLEVERQRFADRLRVDIRLQPDAAGVAVPPLLLQPLVENAVRHGVAREPGAASIEIGVRIDEDGGLLVRVANGARGRPAIREGFGLRHTRRRLDETYGSGGRLDLARTETLFEATLRVPRLDASAAAGAREVD